MIIELVALCIQSDFETECPKESVLNPSQYEQVEVYLEVKLDRELTITYSGRSLTHYAGKWGSVLPRDIEDVTKFYRDRNPELDGKMLAFVAPKRLVGADAMALPEPKFRSLYVSSGVDMYDALFAHEVLHNFGFSHSCKELPQRWGYRSLSRFRRSLERWREDCKPYRNDIMHPMVCPDANSLDDCGFLGNHTHSQHKKRGFFQRIFNFIF
ncbi:hypothetical protein [Myxosarcina sp. GI1(2024)]